jgi:hypothetical protein
MPSERLIDCIVDNLKHHVVQTGAIGCISDVHAWALANGLEALKHFDRIGTIRVHIFRRLARYLSVF